MVVRGFVHPWRLKIVAQEAQDANSIGNRSGRVRMMDIHVKQTQSVVEHVWMVHVKVNSASSPESCKMLTFTIE